MNAQTCIAQILDELHSTLAQISNKQCDKVVDAILDTERVFVAGAGRSAFVVKGFAMRLMHMGFTVHVVGETTTPNISSNDLLLIGSGSGATGSLVVMAQKARKIGATIALITILADSPMAQLADTVITLPTPSPKITQDIGLQSIQPMGTLFEQSMQLTLDALIVLLMAKITIDSDTMFARHANLE
jgi:6-phospho-3-hexuloisomerase